MSLAEIAGPPGHPLGKEGRVHLSRGVGGPTDSQCPLLTKDGHSTFPLTLESFCKKMSTANFSLPTPLWWVVGYVGHLGMEPY